MKPVKAPAWVLVLCALNAGARPGGFGQPLPSAPEVIAKLAEAGAAGPSDQGVKDAFVV